MNELLKDFKPYQQGQSLEEWSIRSTYELMMCGAMESPLFPRCQVTVEMLAEHGVWQKCEEPPTEGRNYLLFGHYQNSDGDFPVSILPAWYHVEEKEWEVTDGYFHTTILWMEIPWVAEVWEAAEAKSRASLERANARMEQLREQRFVGSLIAIGQGGWDGGAQYDAYEVAVDFMKNMPEADKAKLTESVHTYIKKGIEAGIFAKSDTIQMAVGKTTDGAPCLAARLLLEGEIVENGIMVAPFNFNLLPMIEYTPVPIPIPVPTSKKRQVH